MDLDCNLIVVTRTCITCVTSLVRACDDEPSPTVEGHFKQSLLCQPDHCSPNPATHPDQTAARRTRHPLVTKQRTCHKPISKELFPPGTARQAAAATVTCPISFEYSKRSACTRLLIRSKSILRLFCLLVQQSPPRQPFDREAVQQGNCFYDMVSTNQLLYKYIFSRSLDLQHVHLSHIYLVVF